MSNDNSAGMATTASGVITAVCRMAPLPRLWMWEQVDVGTGGCGNRWMWKQVDVETAPTQVQMLEDSRLIAMHARRYGAVTDSNG